MSFWRDYILPRRPINDNDPSAERLSSSASEDELSSRSDHPDHMALNSGSKEIERPRIEPQRKDSSFTLYKRQLNLQRDLADKHGAIAAQLQSKLDSVEREKGIAVEELRNAHHATGILQDECGYFTDALNHRTGEVNSLTSELGRHKHHADKERNEYENRLKESRSQISALKKTIVQRARLLDQLTDDSISDLWFKINNDVQNWIITGYRGRPLVSTFDNISKDTAAMAEDAVPGWKLKSKLHKIEFCQSIVSSQLVSILCKKPFFGMPSSDGWSGFTRLLHTMETAQDVHFNDWRANTIRAILREESRDVIQSTEDAIDDVCGSIVDALDELTASDWDDKRAHQLRRIIAEVVSLSQDLKMQLAVYEASSPNKHYAYDATKMESYQVSEGHEGSEILFSITPALFKFGDEHGRNMDHINVIRKANVFCVPRSLS